MHRITADTDARNVASSAVLERVGMRREGYLVQSFWDTDHYADECLYAMLRTEWPPQKSKRPMGDATDDAKIT
jgi:RimJ/RimL family protein N-acetyltransferase